MAFTALIERHGPMVLRVCRRVLTDLDDADDAFQATFLVLVQRAGSIRNRDSVASWLHGVAYRTACCARSAAARRRRHERTAAELATSSASVDRPDDPGPVLHEELERLPGRYREPIVLCDLERLTYEQAALRLGCPIGTVQSRLARGREKLRARLLRRTVTASAGLTPRGLAANPTWRAIPSTLVNETMRAASRIANGGVGAGELPASVSELTEGVLKMIFLGKLKTVAMGVVAIIGLAIGGGNLAQRATEARPATGPRPGAAVQRTRTPIRVAEKDDRWVRTLANGATIEVIGVSPHPSGLESWWGGGRLATGPLPV